MNKGQFMDIMQIYDELDRIEQQLIFLLQEIVKKG